MRRNLAAVAVVAALGAVVVSAQSGNGKERGVLVSASLSTGSPATDLTAADFVVREDGRPREVIRVSPAPPPSHVMLIVDDSQAAEAAVPFLRTSVGAFIKKMGGLDPAPQIALMTSGERPTRRADFAPTTTAVQQAAARIFAVGGSGAYFLQSVMDACKDLKKRGAASPVIVAFIAESGPEFSSEQNKQIAAALKDAGASLWAVVLHNAINPDRTPEEHERAVVLGDVTKASGGETRNVLSTQGLDPAFDAIGSLLASRYLVIYGRPDSTIPPESIEVTSKRANVRMTATRWTR